MGDTPFNEEYLEKLAAQVPEVQRHFVDYFTPLIQVKIRIRLHSPSQVEDIRQETFLRVFKALAKKDGVHNPERLGAFVLAVCNNVLKEAFRANARKAPLPEEATEIPDPNADSSRSAVTAERKAIVRGILAQLSEKDRMLLRKIFLEERDKSLVCRELGVDSDYLRVLIHRAKLRFRNAMAAPGETK